jgi:hypothetical protein
VGESSFQTPPSAGWVSEAPIQVFLFGVSVYIAIASVMIFLSLVLRPSVNRRTNIVLPILYIVSIVASAIGETRRTSSS